MNCLIGIPSALALSSDRLSVANNEQNNRNDYAYGSLNIAFHYITIKLVDA